ncbi:MAG: amidohydrolase [Halodesulfurarchaeum sp.]
MAAPADRIFANATVHPLADPDQTAEAVAVRDGAIVRVDSEYEVKFLEGTRTEWIDLDGGVVLPGFIDAHTHMQQLGQYLVHADLSAAETRSAVPEILEREADPSHEWMLGFGYDESEWAEEARYPTADLLDQASRDRPVAAFRVDMHAASLNSVALERLEDVLPESGLRQAGGEPTGVVVEEGAEVVWDAIAPDRAETRELLQAAIEFAHSKGVTGVHDMVRNSEAPGVYRELAVAGELDLRVRLNYWADHLDAVEELGLRPNHGGAYVRTGAIKTYTDGSFGARTARLSDPYADDPDETGEWVRDPDSLASLAEAVANADQQLSAHAIGDEAIRAVLDALDGISNSEQPDQEEARHRIEHVELLDDDLLDRVAASGAVASVQPNFLRWAGKEGLYEQRLGAERRARTNRFRDMLDAGIPLAFGSDCMPLDPRFGIHLAVNAPVDSQRLSVTEALRAYTSGSAHAGFDEDRLGTLEPGKRADMVVLERSPWEHPERIDEIDIRMTVVDGAIVYEAGEQ